MNKVNISGRAGRDAEVKFLPSGKAVASVRIAVSNDYKSKETGEWLKKPATWIGVSAFGTTAEALGLAVKGDMVEVEGKLIGRKFTDKAGNDHEVVEVLAFEVAIKRKDNAADAPF